MHNTIPCRSKQQVTVRIIIFLTCNPAVIPFRTNIFKTLIARAFLGGGSKGCYIFQCISHIIIIFHELTESFVEPIPREFFSKKQKKKEQTHVLLRVLISWADFVPVGRKQKTVQHSVRLKTLLIVMYSR